MKRAQQHAPRALSQSGRRLLNPLVASFLLSLMVPLAQGASGTRTSAFTYDAASGLLTKEIIEPDNSALCVVSESTYDSYGNKTALTTRNCNGGTGEAGAPSGDPVFASRGSNHTYDPQGRFATGSTNALGQSETRVYDQTTGALLSLTGPNGLTTTWTYDSLGRKVLETRADGNKTAWSYRYCAGLNGGTDACPTVGGAAGAYLIQTTPQNPAGAQNGPQSTTYYDALNRPIRSETQGYDGSGISTLIRQDTEYDNLGRAYKKSRPYYLGQTIYWNTTSYDALGRPIAETRADGTVHSISYNGLTTVATNAAGQTRTTIKNSQGQTVRILDAAGQSLDYTYDPHGNLIQTVDALGNINQLAYDLKGRKTQMNDRDMGTWTYVYNALGELIRQTDAKNQTSTLTYDKLGRLTQRSEPDLIATWTYDACPQGIGKLCAAGSSNGYNRTHHYDSLGRESHTSTTVGGNTYTSSVTYDTQGRVATQTYPSNLAIKYDYTALNYLKAVRNNATSALYWQADTLDAEGHLLLQTYGNTVQAQTSYNPQNGQVTALVAGAGNSVQNFTYQYDNLGNLTSRTDANQNFTESFLYDNRNRLTSSTVNSGPAGTVTKTYIYDALGNILSRSDVGSYQYNPSGASSTRPHAVTRIDQAGGAYRTYGYDANGNLTTEVQYDAAGVAQPTKGRTQTYTSFNMPSKITGNSGVYADFAYGPEHQRVTQYSSKTDKDTLYLNPGNEGALAYERDVKRSGGQVEQRNFITALGQVVAIVKQDGAGTILNTRYLHRDHLGSLTTVTDEAGAVTERLAYEPFGKRRYIAGQDDPDNQIEAQTTDRGYTNHEHLDELGVIHMNGRIYDPLIGRFLSADPIIQSPEDLQSYNRYSYVSNNPLNATDPSGFLKFKFSDIFKPAQFIFRNIPYSVGQMIVAVGSKFCGPFAPLCAAAGSYDNAIAHGATQSQALKGGGNFWAFHICLRKSG